MRAKSPPISNLHKTFRSAFHSNIRKSLNSIEVAFCKTPLIQGNEVGIILAKTENYHLYYHFLMENDKLDVLLRSVFDSNKKQYFITGSGIEGVAKHFQVEQIEVLKSIDKEISEYLTDWVGRMFDRYVQLNNSATQDGAEC